VSRTPVVRIHYRRPPDRLEIFEQLLVHDEPDVKVTLAPAVVRGSPIRIAGRTVLEDRSPVVWFTFPGRWHDIGRFHLADGTFTGLYANVVTPVELGDGERWDTTDLFLDLWVDEHGATVLDRDELDDAVTRGWIDEATATRALAEVAQLRADAEAARWPPPVVREWTLDRARRAVRPIAGAPDT
jgi:predicted RNA-binding protein associated with RNAse of E/G family